MAKMNLGDSKNPTWLELGCGDRRAQRGRQQSEFNLNVKGQFTAEGLTLRVELKIG